MVAHELSRSLADIVGSAHVLPGEIMQDWTRAFGGPTLTSVRPADTGQLAAVLSLCSQQRQPVVLQGGNTGLVAGAVPAAGEQNPPVLLSTTRLTDPPQLVGEHDILAGAGVTLAQVQEFARSHGRHYGVDLAARDTATIGGTVATNAGGIRFCKYGSTRHNLRGLEFVTGTGETVTDLTGLPKDNTGLDLTGLICGSEGILAVVTQVRLITHPQPPPTLVVLIPVAGLTNALRIARHVGQEADLYAAEVIEAQGWNSVALESGAPTVARPLALLLEYATTDEGLSLPIDLMSEDCITVAQDPAGKRRLWDTREGQTDHFSRLGLVHKFDVSLPLTAIEPALDAVTQVARDTAGVEEVGYFGHIADGNIHIQVLGGEVEALTERVLRAVTEVGGSISAEHGIGQAKRQALHLRRQSTEIELMRRVKAAFDPANILNPHVLLPQ
ncbi:MAG: FAD-binding oxidoreductase [Actinobacteria bacterium]|nr:FAD-binding oxidoreductase [Actinomycetota bacterium]